MTKFIVPSIEIGVAIRLGYRGATGVPILRYRSEQPSVLAFGTGIKSASVTIQSLPPSPSLETFLVEIATRDAISTSITFDSLVDVPQSDSFGSRLMSFGWSLHPMLAR
jgi:hypothetical protein